MSDPKTAGARSAATSRAQLPRLLLEKPESARHALAEAPGESKPDHRYKPESKGGRATTRRSRRASTPGVIA